MSRKILADECVDFRISRWVFAHKHKGVGIIFLRYASDDIQKIGFALIQVLNTYQDSLSRKFVVIKPQKIRVRDI